MPYLRPECARVCQSVSFIYEFQVAFVLSDERINLSNLFIFSSKAGRFFGEKMGRRFSVWAFPLLVVARRTERELRATELVVEARSRLGGGPRPTSALAGS